jgi:hypothetical protein
MLFLLLGFLLVPISGSIGMCAPKNPGTATVKAASTPTPALTPGNPSTIFSMDWNRVDASHFPSVPFGGIRLWDTGTSWEQIETTLGSYDWTMLDAWLSEAATNDKDVLYTFGRTPQGASSRPTEYCDYGYDGCAAPPYDVDSGDNIWKGFVTALVQHSLASSTAHIKYYELWNEPSRTAAWSGTYAQLVTMARDAYVIIHTLDPNALVVSPSATGSAPANWLQPYFAAGGSSAEDIVAFHTYVGANPEAALGITDSIRSVMSNYAVAGHPVWVTEGSWGQSTTMTSAQQAAYLAQEYIFLWSKQVARYYWYSWDSSQWGTLWDSITGIHPAGVAYGVLSHWLDGSVTSASPCSKASDGTWTCTLTLSSGYPAEIVWNASRSTTLSLDPAFVTFQTLDNDTVNSIVGHAILIGNKPILLVQGQAVPSALPDFSISVSSSQTVNPGNSATYAVTVGALNGFTGTVTLSASGLPSPGAAASFSPPTISGSGTSIMTITTGTNTAAGTFAPTIIGTSGSLTHSVTTNLVVSAISAIAAASPKGAISIDFVGSVVAMASTEVAGVVPKSNWNNAIGANGSGMALVNETGTATTAIVTWTSSSVFHLPIKDTPGNFRMTKGYLDTVGQNAVVTVTGLPADSTGYDIYVYADGTNPGGTRTGAYQISGTGITTTSINLTDVINTNFRGTFTQANNSNGNYVKFSITATGFTITAIPGVSTDGSKRAPVNGIQIIPH